MITNMKKLIFIIFFLSLAAFAADYNEVRFTKVCRRCGKISHEIQMYAYNSWTDTWQKSWRSDTNRPGCCEECYFELQPRVKFLEKPLNAYTIVGSSVQTKPEQQSSHWWNNGRYERQSFNKPIFDGPWYQGRLKK